MFSMYKVRSRLENSEANNGLKLKVIIADTAACLRYLRWPHKPRSNKVYKDKFR